MNVGLHRERSIQREREREREQTCTSRASHALTDVAWLSLAEGQKLERFK